MIRAIQYCNHSTVWEVQIGGLWLECRTWFEAELLRRKYA